MKAFALLYQSGIPLMAIRSYTVLAGHLHEKNMLSITLKRPTYGTSHQKNVNEIKKHTFQKVGSYNVGLEMHRRRQL